MSITLIIEIVGVLVGLGLIGWLLRIASRLGGAVGGTVRNLIGGVVLFTMAFGFSAVAEAANLLPMSTSMPIHMALMVLAMVSLVLAAAQLANLVR